MKVNKFLSWCLVLALGFASVACSDDDEPEWNDNGSKVELPYSRMFILNEGSFNQNNAGISFFAPKNDAASISDIFYQQNGMRLGDTGQSMIEYRDNIYVAVYGSNYLAKLNAACVEITRKSFVSDSDLSAGIRYMTAKDGYIYASFYGGIVAKINANTLEVEAKLQTGGANLEGIAIEGNNLYVANSYEKVYNPETGKNVYNYLTDVFVIDLRSFTKKETLTVVKNPNQLVEEEDKLFLISWDYSRESYVLQMIDPKANNSVKELGYATNMAAGNDMLYLVDSRTDYSSKPYVTTNTFSSYDIKSGRLNQTSFLKNAPAELTNASVYMMTVDDETGDIYIGVTHYSDSNGDMYRFKKDGTFVEKFDCGGQNPKAAVFFD
jgi:hypothetical protein